MSLPLYTRAHINGRPANSILKVLAFEEFLRSKYDPRECALWLDDSPETLKSRATIDLDWGAILAADEGLRVPPETRASCTITNVRDARVVSPGDIVRISQPQNRISVLHRRKSRTNSLLVTERCNS